MAEPRALADDMIRVPIKTYTKRTGYLPVQITHILTKIHTYQTGDRASQLRKCCGENTAQSSPGTLQPLLSEDTLYQ